MNINITSDITASIDEANKILRLAYLKGYFGKCEDVTNGCDIFRYVPKDKVVEFHIKDPLFWVRLRLDQFIDCQIDLLNRENHHKKKEKNV